MFGIFKRKRFKLGYINKIFDSIEDTIPYETEFLCKCITSNIEDALTFIECAIFTPFLQDRKTNTHIEGLNQCKLYLSKQFNNK